jgi:hypothetical protein
MQLGALDAHGWSAKVASVISGGAAGLTLHTLELGVGLSGGRSPHTAYVRVPQRTFLVQSDLPATPRTASPTPQNLQFLPDRQPYLLNGPAVAALGGLVAVAWFTAARELAPI